MSTTTQWFVVLNPAANKMFAEFLSASGEGSGREDHALVIDAVEYQAWMIQPSEINLLRSMREENPEVFTQVRFANRVGAGSPRFADFFGKKKSAAVNKTFTGDALAAQQLAAVVTGRRPRVVR